MKFPVGAELGNTAFANHMDRNTFLYSDNGKFLCEYLLNGSMQLKSSFKNVTHGEEGRAPVKGSKARDKQDKISL